MNSLPYTINDIRQACKDKRIIWQEHITERMLERGIRRFEVLHCIANGEIIEAYENDKPYPSCLILGYSTAERPIHVVCSLFDNYVFLITTYIPDNVKWLNDLKTRRNLK